MWLLTDNEAVAVEAEGLDERHPGLSAFCLNQGVLQTAWYQYKQQYADAQTEEVYSLQAAGKVGLGTYADAIITVVLPSCAVCYIRAPFPPPGFEDDSVFEGFRFPDE